VKALNALPVTCPKKRRPWDYSGCRTLLDILFEELLRGAVCLRRPSSTLSWFKSFSPVNDPQVAFNGGKLTPKRRTAPDLDMPFSRTLTIVVRRSSEYGFMLP
jgi:hypothetical protein